MSVDASQNLRYVVLKIGHHGLCFTFCFCELSLIYIINFASSIIFQKIVSRSVCLLLHLYRSSFNKLFQKYTGLVYIIRCMSKWIYNTEQCGKFAYLFFLSFEMLFALDLKRIAEQQAVPVDLEPYVKKLNSSRRRVMLVNNILQNVQVYHHFLQRVQVYQHFNQVYLIECTEVCSTGARERSPKCSIRVPATQNLPSAHKHSDCWTCLRYISILFQF